MLHGNRFKVLRWAVGLPFIVATAAPAANAATTNAPSAIPWNQIGARAGADYQGDGLAVTPNESGARLHCVFQRLDGEATPEGLWLTSTVTSTVNDPSSVVAIQSGRRVDRFRVVAVEVKRAADMGSAAQPRRGDMFIARAQPNPIQGPSGRHDAGVFGGSALPLLRSLVLPGPSPTINRALLTELFCRTLPTLHVFQTPAEWSLTARSCV